MPRIPQNLRKRAIDMLNTSMTMNAVAMNIGCSTRAIRHQRFQATWRTEDRPRSGRQQVTTRGQDRYIRNTHLRNRFQSAAANTLVHITTVYLQSYAQSLARVWAKCMSSIIMLFMFWRDVTP